MKKWLMTSFLVSVIGFIAGAAVAEVTTAQLQQPPAPPIVKRDHRFEALAGTWKATCDKMEERKVYCRAFHIEQFGEWKTKNFVQFGPAWSPDSAGFVIATYLGFKAGTIVSIGIDKNDRYKLTAPKNNNLMVSPEVAEKILREMENGHKIVITFQSYSGVRHLALADLGPYKALLTQVETQMARNTRSENGNE